MSANRNCQPSSSSAGMLLDYAKAAAIEKEIAGLI
jgi:hypothetical protein